MNTVDFGILNIQDNKMVDFKKQNSSIMIDIKNLSRPYIKECLLTLILVGDIRCYFS